MSVLHVAHVTGSLDIGGAERAAVELANRLNTREGLRTSVWATRSGGPLEGAVADGVECRVLGRRSRWDLAGLRAFRRWARDERVDIFHSHSQGSMELVSLLRASRAVGGAHVFHDQHPARARGHAPDTRLRVALRMGVDICVFVDEEQRSWALAHAGVPVSKTHVVPNAIDLSRFVDVKPVDVRAMTGADDGDVVVVMVANFRPGKGHGVALEALSRCRAQERIRMALVGGTFREDHRRYERRCYELIARLGLGERVRVLGPRTDVPAILVGCDIGLLASEWESGPIALLEYMAAGLPWVATRTGQITRAVEASGTGHVVPLDDPGAMADGLDRLVTMSAGERAAMGERARAAAAAFDWTEACARLEGLYRTLVADSGDGPAALRRGRSTAWDVGRN